MAGQLAIEPERAHRGLIDTLKAVARARLICALYRYRDSAMGLDTVEIVIRTEKEFGIEIANADAGSLRTPRMLADYVATKVPLQPSDCLLRRTYFALRRALLALGTPSRMIRPGTRLESLVPEHDRPNHWRALAVASGLDGFPPLKRPLLTPHRLVFRRGCETLRDLAMHVATWDASVPTTPAGPWSKETVLLKVRQIVEDELGLHAFGNDDDFVRDLGAD